jgi:hypothetical protein
MKSIVHLFKAGGNSHNGAPGGERERMTDAIFAAFENLTKPDYLCQTLQLMGRDLVGKTSLVAAVSPSPVLIFE